MIVGVLSIILILVTIRAEWGKRFDLLGRKAWQVRTVEGKYEKLVWVLDCNRDASHSHRRGYGEVVVIHHAQRVLDHAIDDDILAKGQSLPKNGRTTPRSTSA